MSRDQLKMFKICFFYFVSEREAELIMVWLPRVVARIVCVCVSICVPEYERVYFRKRNYSTICVANVEAAAYRRLSSYVKYENSPIRSPLALSICEL